MNKEVYEGITGRKSVYVSDIFFIIGLLAAIGIRITLLLNHINTKLASLVWYFAMIAYLFFFGFHLYIEEKRRGIIIKNKLKQKLIKNNLSKEDRHNIKILLDSILVSKLYWNMIILLILSTIIIIIQIGIDLR